MSKMQSLQHLKVELAPPGFEPTRVALDRPASHAAPVGAGGLGGGAHLGQGQGAVEQRGKYFLSVLQSKVTIGSVEKVFCTYQF